MKKQQHGLRGLSLLLGLAFLAGCSLPGPTTDLRELTPAAVTAIQPTLPGVTPTVAGPSMTNVIPRPVSVEPSGGTFELTSSAAILVDAGSEEEKAIGQYLADHMKPSTGFALPVEEAGGASDSGNIILTTAGADPALGEEGYDLTITSEGITVSADKPAGLFYGVQTIRQLLPPEIDSDSAQAGPWTMGTGKIHDYPRFGWRGAMLDVARHFFTVRDVTKYIDLLAYYKINRLHLHLTDDQGWRIQINSWPNLTLHGGSSEVGGTPGGYYSQDDYSYIINYARSRYITVIPEIEMPGHVTAALSSYADLNCNGVAPEITTTIEVGFSSLCTTKDITYQFVEDVIRELAAITPGPYIHVGGDETSATEPADYVKFVEQVQPIVNAVGKQMVGWEEIAQARLTAPALAQHWNIGDGMADQAVQQGLKVIMSPADRAYMDQKYNPSTTLGLDWAGDINVERAYSWDPATQVPGVSEAAIAGVEAPLWSETLTTLDDIEYMAFPRLLGFAEIGWTPQGMRDWYQYKARLAVQGPRMDALGINYYKSPEIDWP